METIVYIILSLLIGLDVYLIIKLRKLGKMLGEKSSEHNKKLSEAGNAITDTLRVVFDNLKRQSVKTDKLDKKETEYQSRFHKIENDIRRLVLNMEKTLESKTAEEKKYERNNKTN
jgi:hypothetical protein